MINELHIRFSQVFETWKANGMFSLLHKAVFLNSKIIPVEKDLDSLKPPNFALDHLNAKFIEISGEKVENHRLKYALKSRYLKILRNLERGYEGFALVKGDEIIGDIWYVGRNNSGAAMKHADLKLLNIHLEERAAYMFDMFVKPEERGGGITNFFLLSTLNALKDKGFIKVYGYYATDNLPALWVHRTLGFKEMKRLRMQRILFFRMSSAKGVVITF